ncbi:hypothetical protein GOHSU_08_00300 [Gordonia hirsuta DSM 44140 = NBRC 16056]|uniref:VWFA domain-containing protein n=1 Tax=Gordonia hirsuta DSM 44140 = NBRC 16056 TaxID=1121927 RepID=L7L8Z6_9ACTN|nr:vWA domain-containing protein [Gordonia hirsuta]GAC56502.1 hypothetical protein GOHSU_08_00300 [Gordonia hirsuta DSM 44140 = NBRC 16056]
MWRWQTMVVIAVALLALSGCSTQVEGTAHRSQDPSAAAAVPTVVVLDASESMTTDDAPGPRWTAAKTATQALVDSLPAGTRFGLVVFGADTPWQNAPEAQACADVKVVLPLGAVDAAGLAAALDGIVPQGRTPIGTALQQGAQLLPDTESSLVLISDGESNCAPDLCETAESIRTAKPDMRISAVGLRTDAPSLNCVADRAAASS